MRLFTHLKAFGDTAASYSNAKDSKPRTMPDRPISNVTHEAFSITTPSDGVIAQRRCEKKEATSTMKEVGDDYSEKHSLFHEDEDSLDEKVYATPVKTSAFTFSVQHQKQHNPYFPPGPPHAATTTTITAPTAPTPPSRKRKRELVNTTTNTLLHRVKSVKLSSSASVLKSNTKHLLRNLCDGHDDHENDLRRFYMRAPALEANTENLREELGVQTSAQAMRRFGDVVELRRREEAGFGFGGGGVRMGMGVF